MKIEGDFELLILTIIQLEILNVLIQKVLKTVSLGIFMQNTLFRDLKITGIWGEKREITANFREFI